MLSTGVSTSPTIPLYLGRGRAREHRSLSQLRYMKSDMNYTWLVWATGERLLLPRSLSYFLARLPAGEFVQLHRQYVVNQRFVAGIEGGSADDRVACLSAGERLPISRRRWALVRDSLLGWLSLPCRIDPQTHDAHADEGQEEDFGE